METIVSLIPLIIITVPFAIGNYFLAPRLKKSSVKYVFLSIIPVVNYIFFLYLGYIILFQILDQLKELSENTRSE